MIVSTNKYDSKDFLKFMREASNVTQEEFANSIGKLNFGFATLNKERTNIILMI